MDLLGSATRVNECEWSAVTITNVSSKLTNRIPSRMASSKAKRSDSAFLLERVIDNKEGRLLGLVDMVCVIDSRAFDKEEESLRLPCKNPQCRHREIS